MLKRLTCILFSILLLIPTTSVAMAKKESYPVVFVAGYTSSRLWLNRGTENQVRVWKQDVADKVIEAVKEELPGVVLDAGFAVAGCYERIFDTLAPYVDDLLEYLKVNPDGTSKYDH